MTRALAHSHARARGRKGAHGHTHASRLIQMRIHTYTHNSTHTHTHTHKHTQTLQASVSPASSSNPGVPPSSLMSFLRVKPAVQGVVLTEFDREYSNPCQGSRFDDAGQTASGGGGGGSGTEGIARAAAVVAAAVHALASGRPEDQKVLLATPVEGSCLVDGWGFCLPLGWNA